MTEKTTSKKRINHVFIGLLVLVVGMFFFSYALVPFYNLLCKTLGINGKTEANSVQNTAVIDKTRTVTVQFVTTNNGNLPWDFYPAVHSIEVHPGEDMRVNFFARNNTDHAMTVQAIPSVTPGLAASHFKKTECFCFTQQTLKAHEFRKMPLLFYLDNKLPKDIHTLTLSYSLFKARKKG